MSSGIEKPFDRLLSTKGTEWHGMAEPVEVINEENAKIFFFNIRSGRTSVLMDEGLPTEELVTLKKHKALVADLRGVRDDLSESELLVPVHVPKSTYREIQNKEVWDAMRTALKDVEAEITCVGTLFSLKRFFISVKLEGGEINACGDKFLANLNFITSHDGSLCVQAYDSTVRIVCNNTLRWSLEAAGDVSFKVSHSSGANLAMERFPELLNAILRGRAEFKNQMEYLATIPVVDAYHAALGYFAIEGGNNTGGEGFEPSTRTLNMAQEIELLFKTGKGNKGKTAYDLLNGATEYWSHGGGVGKGKDITATDKLVKANFGAAAEHKTAFCNFLLANRLEEMVEAGKRAAKGAKKE